jgi:hypothetical protein
VTLLLGGKKERWKTPIGDLDGGCRVTAISGNSLITTPRRSATALTTPRANVTNGRPQQKPSEKHVGGDGAVTLTLKIIVVAVQVSLTLKGLA